MIRVMVVDDHRLLRSGLERLLATAGDFEVVASVADGAEACRLAQELTPDVVLMDLSMPGMSGIEATRKIVEVSPDIRVVVLTSFAERDQVVAAVAAGAVGYLLKDSEPEELFRGVHAAARGESPLDARVAGALMKPQAVEEPTPDLTARELEVLSLVGEGLANKQIARALSISEKTVKAHLTSIFQRLNVADRTQAALWAQQRGIGRGSEGRVP
jgi:DNA-binding NarL/FixJ family response regulator